MKSQQIDRTIAITRRNIEAHEAILKIVQSNESNGNSTVADVKRVATRLESARSALIDLTTERTNAADAFRRLTDVEVDRVVDHVSPRLGGDPARLTQERLDLNPEIAAIQSEIASLKQQLESVRSGGLPNLGVESNYKLGRQMSEPDSTMDRKSYANVLLSLRVPVLDGGANDSMRHQVAARLEASYLRLDKRRRELAEDARGAQRISVSDKDKSGALVARADAARKVKELYFEQFKDGGRTIFELLDSQVDLVKAETDLVAQDFNRRRARIKTLLLDGTLVATLMRV
jgi:outer membrane protein TolC